MYILLTVAMVGLIIYGNVTKARAQNNQGIRLVLQITIDGLRADLVNRYEKGFGEVGFRILLQQGCQHLHRPGLPKNSKQLA